MAVTKKPVAKKAQLHQKSGKKGIKGGKIRGKGIKRKINLKFVIDCTHPAEDSILDVGNFEKYLKEHVKVEGKTNNLGNHVVVARDKTKVAISAGQYSCLFQFNCLYLDEMILELVLVAYKTDFIGYVVYLKSLVSNNCFI